MSKDCLYVAVLLVIFINNVKTEAINDLDPSGSFDHENMEFDDSVIENDSNIESSFNNGIHFAVDCKCDKGKCVLINGKLTCTCPSEFGVSIFNNKVECKECECGKGVNCTFNPDFWGYNKKCVCPFGFKYISSGKKCEDACTMNPCKNSGTCEPIGKSFKCNCKTPFFGEICEKNACTRNPCKTDGTCKPLGNSFECSCKQPYFGDTCEKSPCTKNPCLNNGTCSVYQNSYKCDCKSPYSGKNCTEDPCTAKPCKNGGTCKVNGESFKCECEEPFSGNTCETKCTCENGHCITDSEGIAQCTCPPEFGKYTITSCAACKCGKGANCTFDPGFFTGDGKKCVCPFDFKESDGICEDACTNTPCKNGGTCQPMGKFFKCTCKERYFGDTCEKVFKHPCSNNPCQNGGTCKEDGPSFKCDCKTPYFGTTCETEIDTTQADTTISDRITTGPVTTNKTGEITTNTYECYCGENSVSCRLDGRRNKLCFCKDGFNQRRGMDICSRTCQSNADCRNDGICDRDGPVYFCLCREPFIGDRCELDVCNSMRFECRSKGAECVRQGTTGVCKCPMGKKMSLYNYCEDVCTFETCVYGTCEFKAYNFPQYVCNCYEGYYGRHCENVQVMQYTPSISILAILASGIVLFSITSIVAGCWVKKLRKKIAENTKQTGQP